jgi:hypothetical protein
MSTSLLREFLTTQPNKTNGTKEDTTGQPVASVIGRFALVLMPKSQFTP